MRKGFDLLTLPWHIVLVYSPFLLMTQQSQKILLSLKVSQINPYKVIGWKGHNI